MHKGNYREMKRIIMNLSEWMNTPNDELENMMGISWWAFSNLVNDLKVEKNE